ncbi:hypothetical protein KGQ20_36235 [Catenulispora sp. NF23]|uniref:Uncharacterized protein n=1 Tax=Catenulispora pinistramenti TaxID=2705254 RepID=A0ABS5L5Q1_9ACTN|nr:hypothetical protein [Catenulispora pinistramenti]MBS2538215.1 hypothetical protein [Catenulispora pinistramenti]MBS2553677.1 hypothetical protein [Catenulispora pinistramenti]
MTEDATGAAQQPVPRDYRLATPEGWNRIVLEPAKLDGQIDRIVSQVTRGKDDVPHLKQQLAEALKAQALQAWGNGGMELYLSMQQVGEVMLSGSLLTTYVPPKDGPLPTLVEHGTSLAKQGEDVSMVDLAVGPALRHRYRELPDPANQYGNSLPITHLDYHLEVPNSQAQIILSFSTPLEPLANQMVTLFDTITATIQWLV